MRRSVEASLRRLWTGEGGAPVRLMSAGLVPLELAYRSVVALRNRAYDRKWIPTFEPPVPVVSVGNLIVGGAGKTPVAARIARILADHGRRPAVASRGYGEDELALHRRWNPDVPVFAHPERVRAVEEAAAHGCRAAVLDDGFQHRRLRRKLDIVLLPVEGPWSVRLLPRGPYREPLVAAGRADVVLLTRRTADREAARRSEARIRTLFPGLPLAHALLEPDGWSTLAGEPAEAPSRPLLAVTGIARPEAFASLARRVTGSDVELMVFPDHHVFSEKDLARIRGRAPERTVVTTEKDAARLTMTEGLPDDVRVLRLAVREEEGWRSLRASLLDATAEASSGADAGEGRPGGTFAPGRGLP